MACLRTSLHSVVASSKSLSSAKQSTRVASVRAAPSASVSFASRARFGSVQKLAAVSPSRGFSRMALNVKAATVTKLQDSDKPSFVDSAEAFIFDCDGVIWRGDSIIPGIPETLDMLRAKGKKLIFVTNNSTKSRKGYLKKFHSLGLTSVQAEEIFSSSFAAAAYFEMNNFKATGKKVYVVGEVGIQEELDLVGIPYFGGPEDGDKKIELKPGFFLDHDPDVGAVVVGFDRNVNYYKIQYATLCVRENPGCKFIATNTDAVTHLTDAQEWAGNGSMVGAIKGSTQREPIVVGKPAPFMLDYIANKFEIRKDQICMVGDRLDTDILFGKDGGLRTLLVLSGVTTEERLMSPENEIQPDYYTSKLGDLLSIKASVNAQSV